MGLTNKMLVINQFCNLEAVIPPILLHNLSHFIHAMTHQNIQLFSYHILRTQEEPDGCLGLQCLHLILNLQPHWSQYYCSSKGA